MKKDGRFDNSMFGKIFRKASAFGELRECPDFVSDGWIILQLYKTLIIILLCYIVYSLVPRLLSLFITASDKSLGGKPGNEAKRSIKSA